MLIIRDYKEQDEKGWVQCRTLAFLETAYFDNVLRNKEKYESPSIELVADIDGKIVGIIDVEYEVKPKTVCTKREKLGGMIWHIAVHPDYQRNAIGGQLLEAANQRMKNLGIHYLEAWTRDDQWVQNWYQKMGFEQEDSYYHIYLEGNEGQNKIQSNIPNLFVVNTFAHYIGEDLAQFDDVKRKHECVCYVKELK